MNYLAADINKRNTSDRRKSPTPIINQFTLWGGRRRTVRRDRDKKKHLFVDLYSARLLNAVIAVLLLSCADAYLTLLLIQKGLVVEVNPVMASVMELGITSFTIIKFIITAAGLLIFCLFKNARITRISLPIAIKIYVAIVAYEVYIYLA